MFRPIRRVRDYLRAIERAHRTATPRRLWAVAATCELDSSNRQGAGGRRAGGAERADQGSAADASSRWP